MGFDGHVAAQRWLGEKPRDTASGHRRPSSGGNRRRKSRFRGRAKQTVFVSRRQKRVWSRCRCRSGRPAIWRSRTENYERKRAGPAKFSIALFSPHGWRPFLKRISFRSSFPWHRNVLVPIFENGLVPFPRLHGKGIHSFRRFLDFRFRACTNRSKTRLPKIKTKTYPEPKPSNCNYHPIVSPRGKNRTPAIHFKSYLWA